MEDKALARGVNPAIGSDGQRVTVQVCHLRQALELVEGVGKAFRRGQLERCGVIERAIGLHQVDLAGHCAIHQGEAAVGGNQRGAFCAGLARKLDKAYRGLQDRPGPLALRGKLGLELVHPSFREGHRDKTVAVGLQAILRDEAGIHRLFPKLRQAAVLLQPDKGTPNRIPQRAEFATQPGDQGHHQRQDRHQDSGRENQE